MVHEDSLEIEGGSKLPDYAFQVMLLSYRNYLEKRDEIASIFSREAIRKGSFDKYALLGRIPSLQDVLLWEAE